MSRITASPGLPGLIVGLLLGLCCPSVPAVEWWRFRGPNGSGVADDANPPIEWDDARNLAWKTALPGPGTSSPIVVGDRVFVTCYTGYGLTVENPGNPADLKRHLLCLDIKDGEVIWEKVVGATVPEDAYQGFISEHGYASSTPASDGERIYVFFGKSGVLAFDLDGNPLWQTGVGTESGPQRWGSASSPIVYKDKVLVNAAEENEALVALHKETGEQIWKAQAHGFTGSWSTPIVVGAYGESEIVVGVPNELWGFNPETGKLAWFCTGVEGSPLCASPISQDDMVYLIGGRAGQGSAIRAGGTGDVTSNRIVWNRPQNCRIATPVLYRGNFYWIYRGIANCVRALDGERIYRVRIEPGAEISPRIGAGPGGGDYASPVAAGGRIYNSLRSGEVIVVSSDLEYIELARNRIRSDTSGFNATPAISGSRLLLRSNEAIYCLAEE